MGITIKSGEADGEIVIVEKPFELGGGSSPYFCAIIISPLVSPLFTLELNP